MKKRLINFFYFILIVSAIGLIAGKILEYSIDKQIKSECIEFKRWTKEIRRDVFYITPTQKEICDSVGVKINARISKGPLQYLPTPRKKEVRI